MWPGPSLLYLLKPKFIFQDILKRISVWPSLWQKSRRDKADFSFCSTQHASESHGGLLGWFLGDRHLRNLWGVALESPYLTRSSFLMKHKTVATCFSNVLTRNQTNQLTNTVFQFKHYMCLCETEKIVTLSGAFVMCKTYDPFCSVQTRVSVMARKWFCPIRQIGSPTVWKLSQSCAQHMFDEWISERWNT